MKKNITLNGKPSTTSADTIAALKEELGIAERKVAMEKNRVVVRQADYAQTEIVEGDEIEVVEFIGGG